MSGGLLTFFRRDPDKTITPEDIALSSYFFLIRDNSVHEDGIGDGYHTQEELRTVIQNDMDKWEGSGRDSRLGSILDESRAMLEAMQAKKAARVDYLPKEFRDIDPALRVRVTDLMNIAWEVNNGVIDTSVIDRAWKIHAYNSTAQNELERIVAHLAKKEGTGP